MASPTTTTTPGLLSLPTSVLLTIRTLLSSDSLPSHHHHPTTTLESHLSLSRTCILLRSLYVFGTPAEEDAFWRDECRKAGFGRPLRRVWVDELRENEEGEVMRWKGLAMVLVKHRRVCEIRACVDANRWGGDVARFENPDIPSFHPLYTYLHHSHSSPFPAPLPGKSSASYIPPRHQQPSPTPPPPPQNTPQSYSPSPSPSAYPPTSSTQSHVHNLLSPTPSSSSSSVPASTTSTSTSSSSTSSSTTLVESNPYPYPSPSPSPPPSKSHSHSHSPPPPSSHPTPNTTAPPPTLSLDPSQILSTALPTFPDCRHKLFAPLAAHANASCVFVTEPVVGRVRLVRRRLRFDGGARKMVVKRRCKVPMRSDGRTVWVGRSLVDESDESDSDSDDSSDSEEDEHEEEEEEEWTWAWKVDRPLGSYSFEAGERYGEGNEMEEQEEEEEGEEVVGSVCNPDGVTLLDLNRLLVDVLPRTEHEAIQALTIYTDLVSSYAFPDLLDHLNREVAPSHLSSAPSNMASPPPPPQSTHDLSTPRLRVSSTSTGMGIGNIESELDNALHTSLFADSDPNTPSPASATDIVGEPPALTLEAILRTRKHRGFMADHRYPYVDLFEGWYAGMRLRERELSVAEVQVEVQREREGARGEHQEHEGEEEEKEDREQEQEDEALEIESRALPAYLRRPHGVIESPRHGRVYTFGTHAHAPGFGEDSEEPSSAYALVEAKSSRLRSASRSGMRSRTRSALRPRSVSSVLSSSESSSARSGSAMSTSTNDGVSSMSGVSGSISSNDGISSMFSNDGISSKFSNDGISSSISSNDGPISMPSSNYGVSVTDSETEGETETDADVLPTPQDEEGEFVFTLGMNMNIMNGGTGTGTGTGTVRASKGPYAHGHGFNQAYHQRQSYAHSHQHQHHHYHYQPQHDAWKGGCGMTVTEDDKAFEERIEHVDVSLTGEGGAGVPGEGGVLEPLGLGLKVGSLGFETEGEMGGSFAFGG